MPAGWAAGSLKGRPQSSKSERSGHGVTRDSGSGAQELKRAERNDAQARAEHPRRPDESCLLRLRDHHTRS
jgi:hypothetical protein